MPENNQRRTRRTQQTDNTYAHVQPQATEIERAVLGALMIDKDAYTVVCEMLYPESFYEPRNQKVYEAIRDLELKEQPVDVWTVTEQLAKQGDLEDVGGPAYVMELSSRVASFCQCRVSCPHHRPEVPGAPVDILCQLHRDEGFRRDDRH